MNPVPPPIPDKRYFTVAEVTELCSIKLHVLHHLEQEFAELNPANRGGNRRYYQREDVLLVRRICEMVYGQGCTLDQVRARLYANTGPSPDEIRQELAEIKKILSA